MSSEVVVKFFMSSVYQLVGRVSSEFGSLIKTKGGVAGQSDQLPF
ncbi:hypothetical protein J28TS4_16770 [Paenibacillus lautus]|nr:hypothetical protein J28TS4_16770 [Paenibacillus lautus]